MNRLNWFSTLAAKRLIAVISAALLALAFGLHLAQMPAVKSAILIFVSVFAGFPIAIAALKALRFRNFSIDLLVTIAILGALWIGEFVESSVLAFLFILGAYLEARTMERTRSSIQALLDFSPKQAQVLRDGKELKVPVDEVQVGETVLIRVGTQIPADGSVISGSGTVNEASITVESAAVAKAAGSQLFSGTLLESGYLEMRAQKVGEDTTFAQIIELLEQAQESKVPTQKFIDRFAKFYTPAIIVAAILAYFLTQDIRFALTFLVISCPGALVIATPVSLVAGLGNASRHGVLIKSGEALEALARTRTFVFDKTGTLTSGKPQLQTVEAVSSLSGSSPAAAGTAVTAPAPASALAAESPSPTSLLQLAASLEQGSEHQLAQAVLQAAQEENIPVLPMSKVEVIPGIGISGVVDGQQIAVGSDRLLAEHQLDSAVNARVVELQKTGSTVAFILVNAQLAGILAIADAARPEAAAAIKNLFSLGGGRVLMLTGDNAQTAAAVAQHLGITEVQAGLLPAQKAEVIAQLKTESSGRVAMVGDGINDAPALASADIGISMGGGTDVAMESADVVLLGNRFDQLVHAFALAQKTWCNLWQNTAIALVTVLLLIAGTLFGLVHMASGMLIHELSVLAVILNALRLNRFQLHS